MSSSTFIRGPHLLPLWKRRIPKYPLYYKGDPQLRVFLPQFWMKMLKSEDPIPKNQVHFEVHPQMTDIDIKNYLEKIYKVPVLSVTTKLVKGADIKDIFKPVVVAREPDKRLAYLVLADGHEFTFPEIFKQKLGPTQRDLKEAETIERSNSIEAQKNWERASIPPWFRF